jgi:uncharacterized protein YjbI with pentapeptide repeats
VAGISMKANLKGANLSGADITNADFSCANLSDTRISEIFSPYSIIGSSEFLKAGRISGTPLDSPALFRFSACPII